MCGCRLPFDNSGSERQVVGVFAFDVRISSRGRSSSLGREATLDGVEARATTSGGVLNLLDDLDSVEEEAHASVLKAEGAESETNGVAAVGVDVSVLAGGIEHATFEGSGVEVAVGLELSQSSIEMKNIKEDA